LEEATNAIVQATGTRTPVRARQAIWLVTLGALLVRLFPLLLPGGPLAYVVNYDEGIYFSASALLLRGALPYRDVFFVQPPGMLLLLSPITAWANAGHMSAALALTRYLMTIVGAANTLLVGSIGLRAFGPLAGISAALLYATFPEVIREERGPFLEPVLNLACLAMAWLWLQEKPVRRYLVAGLVGGLALSVKSWAAVWLVAALWSLPRRRPIAAAVYLWLGVAAALVVLILPFAVAARGTFLSQAVGYHLQRGPQGVHEVLARLWDMNLRHPVTAVLALTGAGLWLRTVWSRQNPVGTQAIPTDGWLDGPRAGRYFVLVLVLTIASFVVAPIYFHRYASFLAPSEAALGGLGTAWIHQRTRQRWPALIPATLLLAAGSQVGFELFTTNDYRRPDQLQLARVLESSVPRDSSVFALEPGWLLVADRLPDAREGILGAWAGFQKRQYLASLGPDHSANAVQAARADALADTKRFLRTYRFFVTGDWPLGKEMTDWLAEGWIKRYPAAGQHGLALWEQRSSR